MKKSTIILIIIILSILALIFFLVPSLIITPLTGKAINPSNTYTYTKAICDDSNFCEDHVITCKGNQVKNIRPITGAAVQFEDDWEDPRDKEVIERLC